MSTSMARTKALLLFDLLPLTVLRYYLVIPTCIQHPLSLLWVIDCPCRDHCEKDEDCREGDLAGRILEGEEEKKYWAEKVTPFTTAKAKQGNRSHGSFKRHRKE